MLPLKPETGYSVSFAVFGGAVRGITWGLAGGGDVGVP